MTHPPPADEEDAYWASYPPTLTTAQLAKILSVGRVTVFTRLSSGIIPAYRIERSWVVFRDEVRSWLATTNSRSPQTPASPVDVLQGLDDELTYRDLMILFAKSKPTIYRWMESGVIPAFHVGSRWVVQKSQLRQALRGYSNQTTAFSE
ncbi:DNA binding domain-containing protein, excisionase family [Herbiconiux ginsengi]|uniref:DNA binding domain-containing protein, excisionase family n=2 Tax=Herbiconiux ginsengi TaxID=381665 RepID=A0A1H3TE36_9MICO|nr:DNA binding domain-containing protein, excisionase family [Herbiconiux ginsengi]